VVYCPLQSEIAREKDAFVFGTELRRDLQKDLIELKQHKKELKNRKRQLGSYCRFVFTSKEEEQRWKENIKKEAQRLGLEEIYRERIKESGPQPDIETGFWVWKYSGAFSEILYFLAYIQGERCLLLIDEIDLQSKDNLILKVKGKTYTRLKGRDDNG